MNARSIVTGAFFALLPALILAFVAGAIAGGAPSILVPTDPDIGTGSGVTTGSAGSYGFWRAFVVTFAVVQVIGTLVLSRWVHRTHE